MKLSAITLEEIKAFMADLTERGLSKNQAGPIRREPQLRA
jgi:hypothetical protein